LSNLITEYLIFFSFIFFKQAVVLVILNFSMKRILCNQETYWQKAISTAKNEINFLNISKKK
jgi:hypothetical protein